MTDADRTRVSLLGPVEWRGRPDEGGGDRLAPRERALLARLAVDVGRVVGVARLIDDLWGEASPAGARNTLQVYVSHLRRRLGPELIASRGDGYSLALGPGSVDAHEFGGLVASGAQILTAGRHRDAVDVLDEALALWRGEPLADVIDYEFARVEATRLSELRATALEQLAEALLACHRDDRVVAELGPAAREFPYRERLRGAVMTALYRQGRSAEALEVYGEARALLRDELGLDPGPLLQALQAAILADDPTLLAGAPQTARVLGAVPPPVPATGLVGRGEDVAALAGMLADPGVRLVSVLGVGGSGKTRLVLEVVKTLGRGQAARVVWVPLVGLDDASQVLPAVGAALRLQAPEIAAGLVATAIEGGPALMVFDNAEHLLPDLSRVVAELLARCPELKLLVTSRAALHVGAEHRYPLEPLPVSSSADDPDALRRNPAVRLFVERAAQVQPGFTLGAANAAAVAGICARLDGLPLALELAAARVGVLEPSALLSRLESRLGLLTAGQVEAGRHRSLRATLDWSHRLLGDEAAQLFAAMAVFRGGWTLEAAERLMNLTRPPGPSGGDPDGWNQPVIDALQELVDASLVTRDARDSSRFTMLETVAEYAGELLAGSGREQAVRSNHSEYFRDVAVHLSPGFPRWPRTAAEADWYLREQDNLRAAIHWAAGRDDRAAVADLATRVSGHWISTGQWQQAERWLERVAQDPEAGVRGIDAEIQLAAIAFRTGSLADIEGHLGRSLQLLDRGEDDPTRLAAALSGRSQMLHLAGRAEEAAREGERAIAAAERAGNPDVLASVLVNSCLGFVGGAEAERARLLRAKEMAVAAGNELVTLRAVGNLVENALAVGDHQEAFAWCTQALELEYISWDLEARSSMLNLMGQALLLADERTKARPALRQSFDLAVRCGQTSLLCDVLLSFAALAAADGDQVSAAVLLGRHETLLLALGRLRVDGSSTVHDRFLADLDRRLGERELLDAMDRGARLSTTQLVDWLVEGRPPIEVKTPPTAAPLEA